MNGSFQILEFHEIREQLGELCLTEQAKEKALELKPYLSKGEVLYALRETTQAREMLDQVGMPPLVALSGIGKLLYTAEQGGCLIAEELEQVGMMLTAVQRLKDYLCKGKELQL
jgi:dsDNA-specific endonuclease/ATPase MutS2